jgi:hypothetical protein
MHRYVWAAVVLLGVAAGAIALHVTGDEPDLREQLTTRMRTTLEQADPAAHRHAGHGRGPATAVICGVHVYGYEPAGVTSLTGVRTVYGFHLCGAAEPRLPWDVAAKLAGPVIIDMSTDPARIQVVEATADVKFVDRLHQMFPDDYARLALTEALSETEMTDLRRRYDDAAGL